METTMTDHPEMVAVLRYAPAALQSLILAKRKLPHEMLAYEAFQIAEAMAREEQARTFLRPKITDVAG